MPRPKAHLARRSKTTPSASPATTARCARPRLHLLRRLLLRRLPLPRHRRHRQLEHRPTPYQAPAPAAQTPAAQAPAAPAAQASPAPATNAAPASSANADKIIPIVVVTVPRSLPGRETWFTTKDGATWVQTDSQRIYGLPDTPFDAELKPGAVGSTFLVPKTAGRAIRVKLAER